MLSHERSVKPFTCAYGLLGLALSNQTELPAFFSPRQVNLKSATPFFPTQQFRKMTCRDWPNSRRWLTENGQIPEDDLPVQILAYESLYWPGPGIFSTCLSERIYIPLFHTRLHSSSAGPVLYYFCISVYTENAEIRELWNWIWWGRIESCIYSLHSSLATWQLIGAKSNRDLSCSVESSRCSEYPVQTTYSVCNRAILLTNMFIPLVKLYLYCFYVFGKYEANTHNGYECTLYVIKAISTLDRPESE